MKLAAAAVLVTVPLAVFALSGTEGIIADFFRSKHLSTGEIFGCWSKTEAVSLRKSVRDFNVKYTNLDQAPMVAANVTLNRTTYHLGVVLDGDCESANDFLQECGRQKLIGSVHKWLIITSSEHISSIFTNVSLHIDTNLHVAVPTSESKSTYTIYDVYNPSSEHRGDLKIHKLGNWTVESGYNANITINKYWFRKNMTGVLFKSAVVIPVQANETVEEYLAKDTDREVNSMHRFQSVTIKHCQDMYNFSLDIRKTESWGYIVPHTGGKFDGLVGLLQRREVDFGCSPLIFKYDRLPVVDYSFGNWILKSVFIYQPPKSSASSFEIFLRPLGRDVWICTFFASVLTAILLKTALCAEWSALKHVRDAIDTRWSYIFVTISGAFCLQGASYSPSLFSGRILTMGFFVFYFLLYQFYSGYIVSYLLMDPPRMINNLEDLLHSSLDAGIENILIDKDYFVQTKDPVALEIFHSKAKRGNRSGYYEPLDGMELVKQGGFAYHIETSSAYPIIKQTFPPKITCSLEEVQMYRTQPMHTNAQKRSPFREMLTYCMLRLVESGLMYRLRNHWDTHRPECIEADRTIEVTVGLDEFYSALVALLIGAVVSFTLLFCEIYFVKYYPPRSDRVSRKNKRQFLAGKSTHFKKSNENKNTNFKY